MAKKTLLVVALLFAAWLAYPRSPVSAETITTCQAIGCHGYPVYYCTYYIAGGTSHDCGCSIACR